MKKIRAMVVSVLVFGILFGNGGMALAGQLVKVPVGTAVTLKLLEELSSKTASVGQRVMFVVESDVTIGGATIIKKGAAAIGEVTAASSAGMVGAAGALTVVVQTVQAADGTMIPLSATKNAKGESKLATSIVVALLCCVIAVFIKGTNVTFPAGSLHNGFTISQAEVNVE